MSTTIISAIATDILAAYGLPVAGTVGAAGAVAWRRLVAGRVETGRRILLEELERGDKSLRDVPEEELAAVTFRYLRASIEGTARLNLRLLASTASGMSAGPGLYADDFLRWADLIATLRREEIILLGELQRYNAEKGPFKFNAEVWTGLIPLLAERHGWTAPEADTIAAACLRTGLVRILGGLMDIGHAYLPTERLAEFVSLADIEGVLARHEKL